MSLSGSCQRGIMKALVAGSGLTGAATSFHLKSLAGVEVEVWDKARGAGGRMSTSRSSSNGDCRVDLGAQYITATADYWSKHRSHYDHLLSSGLLEPLAASVEGMKAAPDSRNFVAPKGSSSLVKDYLARAGIAPTFGQHVEKVDLDEDANKWNVTTKSSTSASYDALILTMPVPQILGLGGDVANILRSEPDLMQKLEAVEYSSRYALGMFYDKSVDLGLGCAARYLLDDPVLRFVSIDNEKRGRPDAPTAVMVHTSVPFGKEHVEKTPDEVKPLLEKIVAEKFPEWPKPDGGVKCQKWRFSQVSTSYSGQPGCVVVHQEPLLILAGDAFTHSNFDGCVSSAESVAKAVEKSLKK